MSEWWRPALGDPIRVETEDGTAPGEKRFVSGMSPTLAAAIQASASSLATIVTAVDGLEALATALNGYTDALETKLDTIATNQGVPSAGAVMGYVGSIGTGANVTFASKAVARGIQIQNLDATNNLIFCRTADGDPGTTDVDTYTVKPGGLSPFLPCTNANLFNMRSSGGTIAACYAGS